MNKSIKLVVSFSLTAIICLGFGGIFGYAFRQYQLRESTLNIRTNLATDPKPASNSTSFTQGILEPSDPTRIEPKKDFKVGDLIDFNGKQFKVTNVKRDAVSDNQFSKPKTGNEFVIISVEIVNNSTEELAYNSFYFKLQDSTGDQKTTTFATGITENDLNSGTLAQKGAKKGDLVFEVPKGDQSLKLIYDDSFWSKDRIEVKL